MDEDGLKGFTVMRKAIIGFKICPLFADNNRIAEELYKACLDFATSESVYIDIPVVNTAAMALAKKYHTTYVFECARMYYGPPPKSAINKVYVLTTFELG